MTTRRAPAGRQRRLKAGTWDTVADGDRRICADCGTPVRSYRYRFHPPESAMFERCVGLAWCSGCRPYSGHMVHDPGNESSSTPWLRFPVSNGSGLRVRNPAWSNSWTERLMALREWGNDFKRLSRGSGLH